MLHIEGCQGLTYNHLVWKKDIKFFFFMESFEDIKFCVLLRDFHQIHNTGQNQRNLCSVSKQASISFASSSAIPHVYWMDLMTVEISENNGLIVRLHKQVLGRLCHMVFCHAGSSRPETNKIGMAKNRHRQQLYFAG